MEKRLISSYDELNDIFVGKIDGENGYCADYGISDGIFLGIDKSYLPTSIFILNASEVFEIHKKLLESSDVKINIDCDGIDLLFDMFVENIKICSIKSKNVMGIPNLNFKMDSNI